MPKRDTTLAETHVETKTIQLSPSQTRLSPDQLETEKHTKQAYTQLTRDDRELSITKSLYDVLG